MRTPRVAPILALVLLAFPVREIRAHEPGEPGPVTAAGLWQKAVEVFRRNQDWYPQRVTILSEVLNRRGEPYSVTELLFALRLDDQGRMHAELERARKNDKDTTAVMKTRVRIRNPQEENDPDKGGTYTVSFSDSPFDPGRQDAVSITPGSERMSLFGHACRRIDFTYRTQIKRSGEPVDLTWTGMAWLDEASGMPVKLEFTLAPLPSRIRSLWTIYLYETARPDRWFVKQVTIAGHGGFLFIKKRFRSTTTFSEYRRPPSGEGKD